MKKKFVNRTLNMLIIIALVLLISLSLLFESGHATAVGIGLEYISLISMLIALLVLILLLLIRLIVFLVQRFRRQ